MLEDEAIAHVAINALIARYSDGVNRRDAASWAQCWAPDAVWRLRGRDITGRDAILAAWQQAMGSFDKVWFTAFAGMIDLAPGGDAAQVLTHTFEYLYPQGGTARLQSGIYEDRIVRRDGAWVFAERSFTAQELPL